ncbi:MAG: hypothetical protein L6R42_008785 [Xanthoria sp. 1 TBL-2021]|nr:MAG: hypothetical protein L6R42_008785 [Xanthoria sp. 1 TBL-2021]
MSVARSPGVKREAGASATNSHGTAKKPKLEYKLSFYNSPMVTLKVGSDRLPFYVHQNLLCEHSPFFAAALNGPFKESAGSIQFTEDNVEAFERLIQWLYKRDFKTSPIGNTQVTANRYRELVQLYILADKFDMPLLRNHIMTLLFDTIKHPNGTFRKGSTADYEFCPRMSVVILVYNNTVKGSPIRKFMAAFVVWHFTLGTYEDELFWERASDFPELIRDITVNLAKRADDQSNPLNDIDKFLESVPNSKLAEG